MFEYIFFDLNLRDRFIAALAKLEVDAQIDPDEALNVLVPESISDEQAEQVDELYEVTLQDNADLLEQTEDAMEKNVAGVLVTLSDGRQSNIRFDPDLLARLLGCISMEELRDMVQNIALYVEQPDESPLCHVGIHAKIE